MIGDGLAFVSGNSKSEATSRLGSGRASARFETDWYCEFERIARHVGWRRREWLSAAQRVNRLPIKDRGARALGNPARHDLSLSINGESEPDHPGLVPRLRRRRIALVTLDLDCNLAMPGRDLSGGWARGRRRRTPSHFKRPAANDLSGGRHAGPD